MEQRFGTAAFYSLLKAAYDRQDQDTMAKLLFEEVRGYAFQKLRTGRFIYLPTYEREDAFMHAMQYVMRVIKVYLENPLNIPGAAGGYSPGSQRGWLFRTVTNGLNQYLDGFLPKTTWEERYYDEDTGQYRKRRASPVSLDQLVGKDSDGTLRDFLPGKTPTPEEEIISREHMNAVCTAFFKQQNNPETLAAVGFVILNDSLGREKLSLEDYANILNGCSIDQVIRAMGVLLTRRGCDPAVLDPLRKRSNGRVIEGLTEHKLANRKSNIITNMRTNIKDRYGGD